MTPSPHTDHSLHPQQKWHQYLRGEPASLPQHSSYVFFSFPTFCAFTDNSGLQGRAATIAWRRSRGGVGAMGQAFYKGGFEPRMNRKEATLILSLK